MADGRSPVQEKQREKRRLSRAKTFAEFTEVWMEASGMADSTRAMRKHVIDHDILPVFQNRLLVEISPDDLRALCMKVKKRGAPATASLAASSMSGAGVEGVGMNTSYTAHAGENTQASIPWIVGKMPASKVYKNHEKSHYK